MSKKIILITMLFLLLGCGKHQSTVAVLKPTVEKKKSTLALNLPQLVDYVAQQKRDPFTAENNLTNNVSINMFSLRNLRLVGIAQDNQRLACAFLSAPNGQIYRVTVGESLQQGSAHIIKIENTQMIVEETLNHLQQWTTLSLIK